MKFLSIALLAVFFPVSSLDAAEVVQEKGSCRPLFAFDNGTGRDTHAPLDEQARMLQELGYAGIGYTGTRRIPEMLKALDANRLKMFSIYVGANVDPDKPSYDPGLEMAIEQLKGRDTIIWLFMRGGTTSSDDSDDWAVAIIQRIADMAEKSGLRVALYPHVGFSRSQRDDDHARRLGDGLSCELIGNEFRQGGGGPGAYGSGEA